MSYLYSAVDNAFYPFELRDMYEAAGKWPDAGIEVDEAVFSEFISQLPVGKMRVAGDDGYPTWGNILPPTHEELIQAAENERQRLLKNADDVMLDWRTELMLGEISDANRAKLSAWLAYKNEVKSAGVATDPENINWPVPPEV